MSERDEKATDYDVFHGIQKYVLFFSFGKRASPNLNISFFYSNNGFNAFMFHLELFIFVAVNRRDEENSNG